MKAAAAILLIGWLILPKPQRAINGMKNIKVFKLYYITPTGEESYIIGKAQNLTEAKRNFKSKVWIDLTGKMGTVQINKYMKKLKFYQK